MSTTARYRFPGMDPWLEHPAVWPDVHHRLITYLCDELAGRIAPNYYARHGERLVIETSGREIAPDVVVSRRRPGAPAAAGTTAVVDEPVVVLLPEAFYTEPFIEIRDRRKGNRVVTVIEVLSPSNKRAGTEARKKYLEKQAELRQSDVSLMEIDLLRGGEHTVAVPEDVMLGFGPIHYRIVCRRASRREAAEVYPLSLRQRLPRVRVPLLAPDPDAVVDLQPLVERAYAAGGYGADLDYARAPIPPLDEPDLAWARGVVGGAGAEPGPSLGAAAPGSPRPPRR